MTQLLAQNEPVRIDKWLWAARFFKTRALASQAVTGGKVHVDGLRVKCSKKITVGMVIEITRDLNTFKVVVEGLSGRRGSASVAQTLYTETEESVRRREKEAIQRKMFLPEPALQRKPDKRERRQINKFKNR